MIKYIVWVTKTTVNFEITFLTYKTSFSNTDNKRQTLKK